MKQYKDAFYPDKANDFIDNDGNFKGEVVGKVVPLTEDPLEDNLTTSIKVVSLNEEPGMRYKGYVYAIGLRYFPIEFDLTHCHLDIEEPVSMRETEDIEFHIVPDDGYDIDVNYFFVDGIDDYTINPETGYVKLENPLRSVTVWCECIKKVNIHYTLDHILLDPMPEKISKNGSATLTVSVVGAPDYRLSFDLIECVGATAIVNLRNELVISNITAEDDVYLTMSAAHKVTAETSITNGSCYFSPRELWNDQWGGGDIIPVEGYGYPETVSATGFSEFAYDASNGRFSYNSLTSDIVTITAECPVIYPIISGVEEVKIINYKTSMRKNDVVVVSVGGVDNHYDDVIVTDVIGAQSWSYNGASQWSVTISGVADGYDHVEIISSYTRYYLFNNHVQFCDCWFEPSERTSDTSATAIGHLSLTDSDCYDMPENISLTNADLISYDSSTGIFYFNNITEDVTVQGSAVKTAVRFYAGWSDYISFECNGSSVYDEDPIQLGYAHLYARPSSMEDKFWPQDDNYIEIEGVSSSTGEHYTETLRPDFHETELEWGFTIDDSVLTVTAHVSVHSPYSGDGSGD